MIDNKAYLFHVSKTLTDHEKNELRSIFSVYANDSQSLQHDVVDSWQKRIFEYDDNLWLIYMSVDMESIYEELSKFLSDDAWFIMLIGDDYTGFTNSDFQNWMEFHLGF